MLFWALAKKRVNIKHGEDFRLNNIKKYQYICNHVKCEVLEKGIQSMKY